MNVITGTFALSVFPRSTFVHYTYLPNEGTRSRMVHPGRMKEVLRDVECLEDLGYINGGHSDEMFVKREVGDVYCWKIPTDISATGDQQSYV